ncbi:uncharacterized protein RSE6_07837 [Rhynchosporium secalis]|uniref:Uncharacterized protein n=1 Tax=Rhynchosporium secalis TaxID=38038 RepID=A0A1E1MDV9_RHYSE|nr:uncharacterized protein RSE6_07837 [Rhynchosporium secalis]
MNAKIPDHSHLPDCMNMVVNTVACTVMVHDWPGSRAELLSAW